MRSLRGVSPAAASASLKDPQQLYLDWEHAHWAAQDIDLSRDPVDWAALDESERELLYFVLSSLMVAEERISTQFCGLVLAQDDEEEGSYLSTQLVDEVRHMQFYARFQDEVIADRGTIADHVARSRAVLGEPFRHIFDEALVKAHDRLRTDPGDREAKVDFVTIYHMVLEGTLGIVTSHSCSTCCANASCCPASPMATAASPPTSSATSPTAPGSFARQSARTRLWPKSSRPACTTCSRTSPRR